MSVKIRVSYETEIELERVLRILAPVMKSWTRTAKKGRYSRAYIILKD